MVEYHAKSSYIRNESTTSIGFLESSKIAEFMKDTEEIMMVRKLIPEKIIYNDRTTIVYWKDGTKTTVTCADGETFYEENGFLAALAKKIFGGRNPYLKFVEKGYRQPKKKEKILDQSE